jgi:hypothetical protein
MRGGGLLLERKENNNNKIKIKKIRGATSLVKVLSLCALFRGVKSLEASSALSFTLSFFFFDKLLSVSEYFLPDAWLAYLRDLVHPI